MFLSLQGVDYSLQGSLFNSRNVDLVQPLPNQHILEMRKPRLGEQATQMASSWFPGS